jgi:hypothetical protein
MTIFVSATAAFAAVVWTIIAVLDPQQIGAAVTVGSLAVTVIASQMQIRMME